MQVGAVLCTEKTVRSAPPSRKMSARKCANSLQILCTADAQRTKTSAGVAAKTFGRCRISASSCWRVRCRKRAHPAIGHAQNFAKICINDARICCNFFTISTRGAPSFADPSEIIPIRKPRDVGGSNASRRRVARRKNRAFGAAIAQFFRQKMREFVANSLRGRRVTHQNFGQRLQNFGQRRCENILTLQNFCVDLLVRAMPKMRAASGRTCAKFCQNLHR